MGWKQAQRQGEDTDFTDNSRPRTKTKERESVNTLAF
jgi:hypothetical protein